MISNTTIVGSAIAAGVITATVYYPVTKINGILAQLNEEIAISRHEVAEDISRKLREILGLVSGEKAKHISPKYKLDILEECVSLQLKLKNGMHFRRITATDAIIDMITDNDRISKCIDKINKETLSHVDSVNKIINITNKALNDAHN